jgi:hypothetical protein
MMRADGRAKDEEKEKGRASYLLSLSMSFDCSSFLRLYLLALCCKKSLCTDFFKHYEGEMMMMIDRDTLTKKLAITEHLEMFGEMFKGRCLEMFGALENHGFQPCP